jgi:hypothetical protein
MALLREERKRIQLLRAVFVGQPFTFYLRP